MATTAEEMHALIEQLPPEKQEQLLRYTRTLAQATPSAAPLPTSPLPPGTPSSVLLNFHLPSDDVEAMARAIEEDCETIQPDEHEFP